MTSNDPQVDVIESDVSRPDKVREAVTEAARRLFSERGIHAVSVREIAREVGVSHTLLHLYFGSKEEIVRSVLTTYDASVADDLRSAEDAPRAAGDAFRRVAADPAFTRVLAAALVEGMVPHRIPADACVTKAFSQRLSADEAGEFDPKVVSAAIACMVMGWAIAGDWMAEATGLDKGPDELVDEMATIIERMTAEFA